MHRNLMATSLAALTLALAGCSDESPIKSGRADTAPSASPATEDIAGNTAADKPQLTKKQAVSALLTLDEMPTGWSGGPRKASNGNGKGPQMTNREQCGGLLTGGASTGLADAYYEESGFFGSWLSQSIYRMDKTGPEARLALAKKAPTTCTKYTSREGESGQHDSQVGGQATQLPQGR